ncbi:MAG: 4'-phosphopantetheinyl transferase superfamily protein [Saprospiraceae bacterium]
MIGNDIISLAEVPSLRPGFVKKVCRASEWQALRESFSSHLAIWLLWAAKESAYKVYLKDGGEQRFAPKRFFFRVSKIMGTTILGNTQTPIDNYQTLLTIDKELIFAESWSNAAAYQDIIRAHFTFSSKQYQAQSFQLREGVFALIAQHFGLPEPLLRIAKNSLGVPSIWCGKTCLPLSISLSHHGYFGSFCAVGPKVLVEDIKNGDLSKAE